MRKSAIAVIVGIVLVIGVVVFLPLKPGGMPPIIQDQPKVGDQYELNVGTTIGDGSSLSDSIIFLNQTGYGFYVDEDGIKHYIIDAVDTPDIER